jgi:DNA repair protein RecN (Recombination protein N)
VFERPDGAEVLIRREITAAGRSRSFVDGSLATAGLLREVSADLVELHGQHEHQLLLDPIDASRLPRRRRGSRAGRRRRGRALCRGAELRERLASASMDARERAARLELVAFQLARSTP